MAVKDTSSHSIRSDLAIGVLTVLLYLLLAVAFFGCLSIPNIFLRYTNRTVATTLLTFFVMTFAMHTVYGGFDVGRKKSRPVISAMIAGTVLTDIVSYVQLEIMNVNENYNDHLILFGRDFLYLQLTIVVQILLIIFFVRVGNTLYFRYHPPRSVLVILGSEDQESAIRAKIDRYRLQWQITDTALYDAPDIASRIREADVVFLGAVPDTVKTALLKICYDLRKNVMCKAQLPEAILSNSRPAIVDDAAFLEIEYDRMSLYQRIVKRAGDILLSLFFLVVLSPLLALISLMIHLEDGGPVFFHQKRLTIHGREFMIHKFRTMKPDASFHDSQVSIRIDDPRITRIGRLLRRFRIDEIPQFWNVLVGEMSLVGPRPEMISNVFRYKSDFPDFAYREKMKAGITGYAQIEGRYNTTPEDKLMLDLIYIESFSIRLDIKLLLRTLTVFFKKDSTQGFTEPPAEIQGNEENKE